jgi:hypothetical protein
MTDLKSPAEWETITGRRVHDPDGWRGADGRPWTDPITREEFDRRAALSTTAPMTDPLEHRHQEMLERDAARLNEERPVDPPESRIHAAVRRADIAAWLRSPEALRALTEHTQFNDFGFCDGCGNAYPRYAEHLLGALAKAVEMEGEQ